MTTRPDPLAAATPPGSDEAERFVLGSMLQKPDALARATEALRPNDFFRDAHRIIFRAMLDLKERRERIDLNTVTHRLAEIGKLEDVGDATYLVSLINAVPTADNVDYWIERVRDAECRRALAAAGQHLTARAITGDGDIDTLIEDIRRPLVEIEAHAGTGGIRSRTGLGLASELRAAVPSWLVEPILPRAMLALLSGRDKMGKTLLALEIARAVLRGEPLFGRFPSTPGLVCAYLLDDPEGLTVDRLNRLTIRNDPRLKVSRRAVADLSDPLAFLRDVEREAADQRPALVVVDALYLFVPPSREAANDQARMGPVMEALDRIAEHTAAAVLVIAHDNKSGQDVAGSHIIRARAKTILRLVLPSGAEEDPDEGPMTPRRVLRVESKLVPASAWALEVRGVGDWLLVGTAREGRAAVMRDQVLAYLADGRQGTAAQIADALHLRREAVEEALRALVDEGLVTFHREKTGAKGRPRTLYFRPEGNFRPEASDRNSPPQTDVPQGFPADQEYPSVPGSPRENPWDRNSGSDGEIPSEPAPAASDPGVPNAQASRRLMDSMGSACESGPENVAGPHNGSWRQYVSDLALVHGHPHLPFAPGRAVAAGFQAWAAFAMRASEEDVALALSALQALDGQEAGA
jgi:hypothetical protein